MPTAIRKVRIEGFKRFDDVAFVLPGLLDEPVAHLHKTLHDAIYVELASAAGRTGAQLIMATRTCEPVAGLAVTQMER